MKIINLRDFYSTLYNQDSFYDVPDEVAELLILYQKKKRHNANIFATIRLTTLLTAIKE